MAGGLNGSSSRRESWGSPCSVPRGLLVAQPVIGALAARTGSRSIAAAAPLYLGAMVL